MGSDTSYFAFAERSDVHNSRGIMLADRGWLEEATHEFKKAIEMNPFSSQAYDNLATVYAEKGALLESLKSYVKALEIDPDSPTAHFNLGYFLTTHAQSLAATSYQKVTELEWDFPDAHFNLGLILAGQDNKLEAIKEFKDAIQQDPHNVTARHELAMLLAEQGFYTEAIAELRTAAKQDQTSQLYADLGLCYTHQRFYEEARKALQQALEIDKNDLLANYRYAVLSALQNKPKVCLQSLKRCQKLDSDNQLKAWCALEPAFNDLRQMPSFIDILNG